MMEEHLVSVIIPTYNRFKYLLNTIKSIKQQTYTNMEIIIVNDCSTQQAYYEHDWNSEGVIIIHLEQNSKSKFGFACAGGYQRNHGIEVANGTFIAFCDDDDIWFRDKLKLQLDAMKLTNCAMSSSEAMIGNGVYDQNKQYRKYNSEHYYDTLKSIYKRKNSRQLDNGFPHIWNKAFLMVHNCVICSSVVIQKHIIDKVGKFDIRGSGDEDYDYWIRALNYTDSVYVNHPCVYYDNSHGSGREYK